MDTDKEKKLGILQVFGSVIASFVGVQSNEKRERDFSQVEPGILLWSVSF